MDVKHVAKLANLPLNEELTKKLQKDLDATVKLVDELSELDLKDVEPTSQVTGLTNVTRKDKIDKSRILPVTDYFKVKAIFNDAS